MFTRDSYRRSVQGTGMLVLPPGRLMYKVPRNNAFNKRYQLLEPKRSKLRRL